MSLNRVYTYKQRGTWGGKSGRGEMGKGEKEMRRGGKWKREEM